MSAPGHFFGQDNRLHPARLVRKAGVEPANPKALTSEASAFTCFTTRALLCLGSNQESSGSEPDALPVWPHSIERLAARTFTAAHCEGLFHPPLCEPSTQNGIRTHSIREFETPWSASCLSERTSREFRNPDPLVKSQLLFL